ncbi:unknown [Alistipes sp. CAG:53]|nr:unknown [Alistipes sp. CAG:53]
MQPDIVKKPAFLAEGRACENFRTGYSIGSITVNVTS